MRMFEAHNHLYYRNVLCTRRCLSVQSGLARREPFIAALSWSVYAISFVPCKLSYASVGIFLLGNYDHLPTITLYIAA